MKYWSRGIGGGCSSDKAFCQAPQQPTGGPTLTYDQKAKHVPSCAQFFPLLWQIHAHSYPMAWSLLAPIYGG